MGVGDLQDLEDSLDAAVLAEGAVQRVEGDSGRSRASTSATSRWTSTRVTRNPSASRASAQALPDERDTGRSLDQPPIRTATCLAMTPPPAELPDGFRVIFRNVVKKR